MYWHMCICTCTSRYTVLRELTFRHAATFIIFAWNCVVCRMSEPQIGPSLEKKHKFRSNSDFDLIMKGTARTSTVQMNKPMYSTVITRHARCTCSCGGCISDCFCTICIFCHCLIHMRRKSTLLNSVNSKADETVNTPKKS